VQLHRPDPRGAAVAAIWDAYRIGLSGRPAATTILDEWKSLRRFFEHVIGRDLLAADPETRETGAERLSRAHAEARRASGIKDGTVLAELSRLYTTCNWAFERQMIEKRPRWAMLPKPRARTRHLTRADFDKLLGACTMPHIRLFAILAIGTAGRMGAILDLTWDRIDFAAGLIHLDDPE
jgi:integrase